MYRYSTHKEKPNSVFSSLPCDRNFSDQAQFRRKQANTSNGMCKVSRTEVNRVKAGVDPVCLARKIRNGTAKEGIFQMVEVYIRGSQLHSY